ncbi:MAG: aldo/keto reductase [Chitinophagaceae bacterium]|jgi:aryl-alcohol dehydrogenase-like predicted oxidoreductase|nr:aldo/keto reductase [Chitinophagaceae bacterium]
MAIRQLGNSDLYVEPLTFGGNVFGWTIDEKKSFEILDAFVGNGFNFIDTADAYSRWAPGHSGGESEIVLGNWMKARNNRSKLIIATKVGSDMGEGLTIAKKYILKAVEHSLKRLQTDYLDLYQTHWDDNVTPVEETLEAYAQLVKEGKVRWIGASNLSPERLRASLKASAKNGYPKYQTFQPHYNLMEREVFEEALEKICMDNHLGVINYWSLAAGFLSGKYRSEADLSKSVRGASVKKYLNYKGFAVLHALDEIAAQYRSTPASIAIAWLIARPSITAPIASATSVEQLNSLIEATKIELSKGAIEKLNKASDWK